MLEYLKCYAKKVARFRRYSSSLKGQPLPKDCPRSTQKGSLEWQIAAVIQNVGNGHSMRADCTGVAVGFFTYNEI